MALSSTATRFAVPSSSSTPALTLRLDKSSIAFCRAFSLLMLSELLPVVRNPASLKHLLPRGRLSGNWPRGCFRCFDWRRGRRCHCRASCCCVFLIKVVPRQHCEYLFILTISMNRCCWFDYWQASHSGSSESKLWVWLLRLAPRHLVQAVVSDCGFSVVVAANALK